MKRMFLLTFSLALNYMVFGQAPESFNYQAVVRDGSGLILVNKSVSFRISIQQGTVTGTIVYSEKHYTTTNEFGLVNLEIGKGSVVTGSLGGINWGIDKYFIKVELDPNGGETYQFLGTSQLLSVPYALFAKSVENGDKWGNQVVITDATISGAGTSLLPIKLAQQSATSGQVLKWNGTTWLPSADLIGSATGPAGGDLTGSYPDPTIGNGKVTTAKISSTGATTGDVLQYNGSSIIWDYAPGSEIGFTVLNVNCTSIASFGTTYTKIADIGTVNKVDGLSNLEITYNGRIYAMSLTGTGAHFELRVDNLPTTNGRARANLRASETGSNGIPVSISGVFTGLRAGPRVISIWIIASFGTGTTGGFDPGCWTDDYIIVREIK